MPEISGYPHQIMQESPSADASLIAGFRQRACAILLDITAPGYFRILNSRMANEQTLGQRPLRIKVVAPDGKPLPVPGSMVRFLAAGVILFSVTAALPRSVLLSNCHQVIMLILAGPALSDCCWIHGYDIGFARYWRIA
jgi:uncharacterized RDD family membrane protein YckC